MTRITKLTVGKGRTREATDGKAWVREYYELEVAVDDASDVEVTRANALGLIDGWLSKTNRAQKVVRQGVPKEAKPTVDESTKVGEYNPEKIPWIRAEGEKGVYERYPSFQQKPAMLTDYVNLLEDLERHGGKLQRAGLFYWKFPDGSTIGRKTAKK